MFLFCSYHAKLRMAKADAGFHATCTLSRPGHVPATHVLLVLMQEEERRARHKAGHDVE
jgi:hypothetical protein